MELETSTPPSLEKVSLLHGVFFSLLRMSKLPLLRYLLAGGIAAATNLALLAACVDVFKLWYVLAAVLAYIGSFGVSFALQKFLTFSNHSLENVHSQAALYFVMAGINLGVNTLLIFLFVHYAHLYYLYAQIATSLLIAFYSFFLYRALFR